MTPPRSTSFVAARRSIQRLYFRIVQGTVALVAVMQVFISALTRKGPVLTIPMITLHGVLLLLSWYGGYGDSATDDDSEKPWGMLFGFIAILLVVLCAQTGGIASPYVLLIFTTCVFAALTLPPNGAITLTIFTTVTYTISALLHLQARQPLLDGGYETVGTLLGSPPPLTPDEISAIVAHAGYFLLGTIIALRVAQYFRKRVDTAELKANVDPLTGLPNRRGFTEKLTLESRRMQVLDWSLAMLVIDLDHFKLVNDRFDHKVGDAVLVESAKLLRDAVGPVDHVARLGGEEFAVAAVGADLPHAKETADRIVKAFRRNAWSLIQPGLESVTCSVGVTVSTPSEMPNRMIDFAAMIQDADHALLQAKRYGRNQVRIAGDKVAPARKERTSLPPVDAIADRPEEDSLPRRAKFIRR